MAANKLTLLDFALVIYSAGRVFDGLCASELATRSFLGTGSAEHLTSKADVRLLSDLKSLAEHVIARAGDASSAVDASYLVSLNEQITESGALEPGHLRTTDQLIGVSTRYGRHEPAALTRSDLQQLLDRSIGGKDAVEDALAVFVNVARAQPFGDGNKRTALFAANALLLNNGAGQLLSIPYDENSPAVSDLFNDLHARTCLEKTRE